MKHNRPWDTPPIETKIFPDGCKLHDKNDPLKRACQYQCADKLAWGISDCPHQGRFSKDGLP
jgi:hypothetical protein